MSPSVVVIPLYGTRERPKENHTGQNSCYKNDFRTKLQSLFPIGVGEVGAL